jgi:hypothetical protein
MSDAIETQSQNGTKNVAIEEPAANRFTPTPRSALPGCAPWVTRFPMTRSRGR